MNPEHAVVLLIGLILGILYKTWVPYRSKVKAGKLDRFDPKYLGTALAALVGASVTAFNMFDEVAISWGEGWPFGTGYVAVLIFGFFWAIGFNHTINQFAKPKTIPLIKGKIPGEPLPELNE